MLSPMRWHHCNRAVGFGKGVRVRSQRLAVEFDPVHLVYILFGKMEVARRAVGIEALPALEGKQVDLLVQRPRAVRRVAGDENQRRVSRRRGQRVAVVAVIIDAVEDVELAAEGEHRRAARADGARLKRIGQIKIVNPQAAANRGGKEVVLSEPAAPQPLDRAGRREQLAVPLALFQRAVRQNLEVAHVRAEGQPVADRQQLVVARKLRRLMLFHRPFVTCLS